MTALLRFRRRRKRVNVTCPLCHGNKKVELIHESSEEGFWRKEEYVCRDCEGEWEWTYQRPFSRGRITIRAPKWARIE